MITTMHPATALIGLPYARGAQGPDAFSCWGLVRFYFREQLGVDMPTIATGDDVADDASSRAAIRAASEASGWRPTGDRQGREHDIVLMQGIAGPHVGVLVQANGHLGLLHSLEGVGVCFQRLEDLLRRGFHGLVYWRRAP